MPSPETVLCGKDYEDLYASKSHATFELGADPIGRARIISTRLYWTREPRAYTVRGLSFKGLSAIFPVW